MPALSPDAAKRDAFFASLARVENRAHERWVADGLRFLNHPLRRGHAERYIQPSLELLGEIQRTGDIFFPLDWTNAVLGGHNSPAAAQTVTAFPRGPEGLPAAPAAGHRAERGSAVPSRTHCRLVKDENPTGDQRLGVGKSFDISISKPVS